MRRDSHWLLRDSLCPVYAKELLVGDQLARGGVVTSVRHHGNLVTYMSDRGVERKIYDKDKVPIRIN